MNLNLRQISSKLSTRGWIAVGAAALVGIVFIYLLMTLASAPSYTTVVAGDSPSQAQKVTTALAADGIQYELNNDGTAVEVQSSQAGQARDLLDTNGLLAGSGSATSLWDLLGKQGLGESNQQQDEQEVSAEQTELDQTIELMNGISAAQVLIYLPNQADNLFSGVSSKPTASVLLTTTGTLEPTAIKSIAEDVANGVGINVNNVTITDQSGDALWPSSGSGASDGLTAKQSAQQAYDTQQAERADAMLASTIGAGKAQVEVNADLNMNKQTVDSVTYGKTKTPLTSASTKEKLSGDAADGGTAGNNATDLASVAGTSTTGPEKYSDNTLTTANGVDKTVSQANIAPGEVTRQTIAVVVNSSVPATDDSDIESAVESTVGYKPRRDKITISTLPFAKVRPVAVASSSKTSGDLKYAAIGLGSLLFLLFITRLLRKREADEFAGNPTWLRELEMPRPLSELEAQTQMVDLEPPAVVARLRSPVNLARQQVEELVDRDPERVAAQIRQWMTED